MEADPIKVYSVQELLILFSSLPTILPFLIGLLHYHRLGKQMKTVMWFSLVTFAVGVWSAILWVSSHSNLFIGHFYTVVQFVMIARIYQLEFKKNSSANWVAILMIGFTVFCIFNTLYLQPITVFNSYANIISSTLLVIITIVFFYRAINKPKVYRIERDPIFWFTSGVLLYFFCNLFIFAVSNTFVPKEFRELAIPTWLLHNIFMWIFFFLASVALWMKPLPSK